MMAVFATMSEVDNRPLSRCALGLGGNIGDVRAAMAQALTALDDRPEISVKAVSQLYRTAPWGRTDQPDFLNAAALVETVLTPQALLQTCLGLERSAHRRRGTRWGPRTLDIDILYYDDVSIVTPNLTLPHPRMLDRAFVLAPLADIAGDHRMAGRRVREWLALLDQRDVRRLSDTRDWWRGALKS